ncbi:uncharacterized protein COLE_03182 [Cutaneotrichosporon oleaginosum]|uniref:uncharacterized protein n=1 Tax=Cutaneotrichosporon oleaginosum TaxID=879819 RepID=UPI001327EE15|nr:hypothetical protein COLE_03182 [Cutaneotrichosporon oleaginosum]
MPSYGRHTSAPLFPPPSEPAHHGHEPSTAPTYATLHTSHPRLKASELPKFNARDGEDVDQWISKVDAIFSYSGLWDRDLLQVLPLVLMGKASNWFTNLREAERNQLATWNQWKDALRNAFQESNHDSRKRQECLYRRLRANESLADYFDSKTALQKQVYPENTPVRDLISDILIGIPMSLQPMLKSSLWEVRSLEDFRRLLIDLEPGLRPAFKSYQTGVPSPSAHLTNNLPRSTFRPNPNGNVNSRQNSAPRPANANYQNRPSNSVSTNLPKTPCLCGGIHWRRDCPNLRKMPASQTSKTSQTKSYKPSPGSVNATPNHNAYRWRPQLITNTAAQSKTTNSNHPVPPPKQPRRILRGVASLSDTTKRVIQTMHLIKTPTYSLARLGTTDMQAPLHKICLDTGSCISVMDLEYAKRHLPDVERHKVKPMNLNGIGRTRITHQIMLDVNFITTDGGNFTVPISFHLVRQIVTKVIIGNDILHTFQSTIDLDQMQLRFRGVTETIPITCRAPQIDRTGPLPDALSSARLAENYTISAVHQAQVPVNLEMDKLPRTQYYMLSPNSTGQYIHVARSVGNPEGANHFAHIMNVGNKSITLKKNTLLGRLHAVTSSQHESPHQQYGERSSACQYALPN